VRTRKSIQPPMYMLQTLPSNIRQPGKEESRLRNIESGEEEAGSEI
jgi:hypothetical protein